MGFFGNIIADTKNDRAFRHDSPAVVPAKSAHTLQDFILSNDAARSTPERNERVLHTAAPREAGYPAVESITESGGVESSGPQAAGVSAPDPDGNIANPPAQTAGSETGPRALEDVSWGDEIADSENPEPANQTGGPDLPDEVYGGTADASGPGSRNKSDTQDDSFMESPDTPGRYPEASVAENAYRSEPQDSEPGKDVDSPGQLTPDPEKAGDDLPGTVPLMQLVDEHDEPETGRPAPGDTGPVAVKDRFPVSKEDTLPADDGSIDHRERRPPAASDDRYTVSPGLPGRVDTEIVARAPDFGAPIHKPSKRESLIGAREYADKPKTDADDIRTPPEETRLQGRGAENMFAADASARGGFTDTDSAESGVRGQKPARLRSHSEAAQPNVVIGQVNVTVEAPARRPDRPTVSERRDDFASRHYLRRLR